MTPLPSPPTISLELDHASTLTFALEQAGVPIVSSVVIRNDSPTPLEGGVLSLEIAPDLGAAVRVPIPTIHGGQSLDLGVLDIPLTPGRLRAVTEAERAAIAWKLTAGQSVLVEGTRPVEVLAYNEWPGGRAPPALLAMFVVPNHPVVALLLREVRNRLGRATDNNALDGYQSRSAERIAAMVIALYEALQGFGISYAEVPASFEETGQKIRMPDRVLGEQLANCLDMTVLAAACLEQMGLHPLLVVVRGHAFPGVWLVDERFPEGVVGDAARLRTRAALGELLFFDSTTIVHTPAPPFSVARRVGAEALERDDAFVFAIDVRTARLDRYRPLPLREVVLVTDAPADAQRAGARGSIESRTLLREAAALPLAEPVAPAARPPLDPVAARLKQWRDRLLDLSLRNRLLSFRPDAAGALALEIPDAALFEDALAEEKVFDILPRPVADARDGRDAQLAKARSDDAELHARRLEDLKHGVVHCPLPEPEMRARVVNLDRSARTDSRGGRRQHALRGGWPAPLVRVRVLRQASLCAAVAGAGRA